MPLLRRDGTPAPVPVSIIRYNINDGVSIDYLEQTEQQAKTLLENYLAPGKEQKELTTEISHL